MSRLQQVILTLLGAGACAFAGGVIVSAGGVTDLRQRLGAQAEEIQRGNQTLQVGRNVLSDMVQVSPQSPAVLELLRRVGITVQLSTNAAAAPAAAPARDGGRP